MERPNVPPSDRLSFRARLRTRWSDEDLQGVLNNAVYLTLLEEGRHAYFDALGLLEANAFPFLLLQTNARFVQPGRGGADVVVEMATTALGRTSFTQVYRVRDAASDAVWCEAEAVLVTYDAATGAKMPIPEAFRAAVAEREGMPGP